MSYNLLIKKYNSVAQSNGKTAKLTFSKLHTYVLSIIKVISKTKRCQSFWPTRVSVQRKCLIGQTTNRLLIIINYIDNTTYYFEPLNLQYMYVCRWFKLYTHIFSKNWKYFRKIYSTLITDVFFYLQNGKQLYCRNVRMGY